MTTEWTPMEPIQSDCANHADLFGGDIFSDELLDIYNSEEVNEATGHEGVKLTNGKGFSKRLFGRFIDFLIVLNMNSFS